MQSVAVGMVVVLYASNRKTQFRPRHIPEAIRTNRFAEMLSISSLYLIRNTSKSSDNVPTEPLIRTISDAGISMKWVITPMVPNIAMARIISGTDVLSLISWKVTDHSQMYDNKKSRTSALSLPFIGDMIRQGGRIH